MQHVGCIIHVTAFAKRKGKHIGCIIVSTLFEEKTLTYRGVINDDELWVGDHLSCINKGIKLPWEQRLYPLSRVSPHQLVAPSL